VLSCLETENEPAMYGNATFAIVSSNTNINADAIVGKHANQGFMLFLSLSSVSLDIYTSITKKS
jgi:hypothetical protein